MTDKKYLEDEFNPQSRFDSIKNVEPKFWEKKKLEDMSKEEWELICDGCGKCCLNKVEIKNKVYFTNTHCRFLNCQNCSCNIYHNRFEVVPDCRDIDLEAVREQPAWLPKTCAYWLLDNGHKLPDWHPLVSGDLETMHEAKMSLKDRDIVSETGINDYENYIVYWQDL